MRLSNDDDKLEEFGYYKGKRLVQTVTDSNFFNRLMGYSAAVRISRFKKKYKNCVTREIGHVTFIYD